MRSLSELVGLDLRWKMEKMGSIPSQTQRSFVLFLGDEAVVEAQVMWERQVYFDVVMEAGEGTFHAHLDLADSTRKGEAWKAGSEQSLAGFELETEGPVTATGRLTTASGERLSWGPTRGGGYEYVVATSSGDRLLTLAAAAFSLSIGGDPGRMSITPAGAACPELPALVVLGFALANEQVLKLHLPDPRGTGATR